MTRKELVENLKGAIIAGNERINKLRHDLVREKDNKKGVRILRILILEYKAIDDFQKEIDFVESDRMFIP